MATLTLPRGRSIELTATVNASLTHRVEITGPEIDLDWSGTGEGNRIGDTVLKLPAGDGGVPVEVKLSFAGDDGVWSESHQSVIDESSVGKITVTAEDGRGTLDGNDLILRFRWVA
jgi:hypothetical protein